jgi:hypothetical protein
MVDVTTEVESENEVGNDALLDRADTVVKMVAISVWVS